MASTLSKEMVLNLFSHALNGKVIDAPLVCLKCPQKGLKQVDFFSFNTIQDS